jgi:hypothetical protein
LRLRVILILFLPEPRRLRVLCALRAIINYMYIFFSAKYWNA